MAIVQLRNKQLRVSDESVQNYLSKGYSQVDDKGKLVKKAIGGYVPTLSDIAEKDKIIERLNAEIASLKKKAEKSDKAEK